MWKDWNFWLALVTAATAVAALILTSYQIKSSNKQHLFDRRLNAYMVVAGLISLYKENRTLLMRKREDEPQFAIDQEFLWLTNNSYMEGQIEAISQPLKQPYHKNFLKKREDLRTLSTEISLIFDGKEAALYSDFVSHYEETIFRIYQYEIFLDRMREENEKHPMTPEERQRLFPDEHFREAYYESLHHLDNIYQGIIDSHADASIRKQIALK